MLKSTRRPVTYGKTTRRYLLSETQEDTQQRRLWREPSPAFRESPPSSPRAPEQQRPEARSYDFDVPSSDSDSTVRPLGRPSKKRKLTPPIQRTSAVQSRPLVVVNKNADSYQRNSRAPVPPTTQLGDGFDVPSSGDDVPRVKPHAKPALGNRKQGVITSSGPKVNPQTQDTLAPATLPISLRKPAYATPHNRSQNPATLHHSGPTIKRPRGAADAKGKGLSRPASQDSEFLKGARKVPKARPEDAPLRSEVCGQDQVGQTHSGPDKAQYTVLLGRPMTPSDQEDSDDVLNSVPPRRSSNIKTLTPGALKMTDLSMSDILAGETTPPPLQTVPKNSHSPENTPRPKLKDRLVKQSIRAHHNASQSELVDEETALDSPFRHTLESRRTDGITDGGLQPNSQSANVSVLGEGRRRVMYGRQRSHLSESEVNEDAAWAMPLVDTESTSSSRRLQLKPVEENPTVQDVTAADLDGEDLSPEKPLRSVHELRAAGGARRTGILLETIFDDIHAAASIGSARGAVLRLAEKLLEPRFPAEFVRHGSLVKLFDLKCSKHDLFIDSLHAIALLQVLAVSPVTDLNGQNHIASLLTQFSSLTAEDESLLRIAKLKRSNMSRAQQADLLSICRLVAKQTEWNEIAKAETITPRLIGLKGLEICSRRLRQAGFMGQLVDTVTFESISKLLLQSNDDVSRPHNSPKARLANSVLESLSIGDFQDIDPAGDASLSSSVENIVRSLKGALDTPQAVRDSQTSLTLRLCLNISTKAASTCFLFARSDVISAVVRMINHGFEHIEEQQDVDQADLVIDNLVLGFGLLTNVIEELPDCRKKFLRAPVSGRSCLAVLLAIFQAKHKDAARALTESESKVNVAFGYLSVLLCSLCLSDEIRAVVASALGDRSLLKLREAMAQFVIFHQTLDMDADSAQPGISDSRTVYVEMLQQVLSTLNTVCIL